MPTFAPRWWLPSTFLLVLALGCGAAQEAAHVGAPPATGPLPITHVSLFTTGVGYFEHTGTVEGTVELELPVPTEHMDDLLQSLVLQDLDGGRILPVRYPSRDPLPRILSSYSLDLSDAPSLAELLARARGETVRVHAPDPVTGTIFAVERVDAPDDAPRTFLTLSTADGLRRVALDEVRDLRFEREALRDELAAALEAVARHRDAEEGAVRLRFEGEGERRVRIGYVREMPVWKTSYRLVVGPDGVADLQGWAIFDNPSDADLVDVSVSFVAGSPASFVTRLYEPVYVDRPRVDVQVGPALVPEADAGVVGPPAAQARSLGDSMDAAAAEAAPAPAAAPDAEPRLAGVGVQAMAEAGAAGESFEYRVSEPVTILRHESALIPILLASVPTTRTSHFDPARTHVHPASAVRMVNDTGLHLAAGPVTVFDAAGFAGSARMGDVPPGEARMLAFAIDLDVEVRLAAESEPQQVTSVRIRDGTLQTSVRQRIRSEYRIDAGEDESFLVIDHPERPGYRVVVPERPPALTQDGYRFGVRIGARAGDGSSAAGERDPPVEDADAVPTHLVCPRGDACTFEVVQERTESRTLAVADVTPDEIAFFLENVELGDDERAALAAVLERKREIVEVDRRIADAEASLDAIHREQDRIRQNMGALDRTSSLYARYLSDLNAQEDELAGLRAELDELRARRADLQRQLDEALLDFGGGTSS